MAAPPVRHPSYDMDPDVSSAEESAEAKIMRYNVRKMFLRHRDISGHLHPPVLDIIGEVGSYPGFADDQSGTGGAEVDLSPTPTSSAQASPRSHIPAGTEPFNITTDGELRPAAVLYADDVVFSGPADFVADLMQETCRQLGEIPSSQAASSSSSSMAIPGPHNEQSFNDTIEKQKRDLSVGSKKMVWQHKSMMKPIRTAMRTGGSARRARSTVIIAPVPAAQAVAPRPRAVVPMVGNANRRQVLSKRLNLELEATDDNLE